MATTQDYINQLKVDKQNLVSMLNNMGVEASDNETFTSLTPKVGKIVTDPILQDKSVEITENGTTTITADEGYDGLNNVEVTTNVASSGGEYVPRKISFSSYGGTELDYEIANLDTSKLTSMASMFSTCRYLKNVNAGHFITSNVSNMYRAFHECNALTSVDVSGFDTSKVTTIKEMFYYCNSLTELDLSNFDTKNVTNMNSMFYYCSNLTTLILGENFDTSNVTDMTSMFANTSKLTNLVIKSPNFILKADVFTASGLTVASGNIYVPDAYVDTYKTRSYWSNYYRIIKPLSQWQG